MSNDALRDLDKLAQALKASNIFTIQFPLPALSQKKAQSLRDNDRDFFSGDIFMEKQLVKALDAMIKVNPEKLFDGDARSKLLEVIAQSVKDTVVQRFEAGGGDISVRPLKPSTVRAKGSSKVGTDTGSLLSDIKNCKPIVIGG